MRYSKSKKRPKKKTTRKLEQHKASFRDPSGTLLIRDREIIREISTSYRENFDYLNKSGLYKELVSKDYLISHKILKGLDAGEDTYKSIKPDIIPFISYPYEWCFGQLKDAALLTLAINKACIKRGMILKDASAFNIQFLRGKSIFIDTLSFEKYKEGEPWVAYQQFCRHFLAPLLLASYCDFRLMQFLRNYIDGIPLDLASTLLPAKSYLNPSVLTNLHLHAKTEKAMQGKFKKRKRGSLSKNSLLAIIDNLENLVKGLELRVKRSEWGDYYADNSYGSKSMKNKKDIVNKMFDKVGSARTVWDLGANTGYFSRDFAERGVLVINFDNDFLATEKNYQDVKREKIGNVLPLVMDLTNPSSGIGWANEERESLIERGPSDIALALALVHHLAISNNVPFSLISEFFGKICKWLVVEFVPKDDVQIKKMLFNRKDVFDDYNKLAFERAFSLHFQIKERVLVKGSGRVLYLMKKND